MPAHIIKQLRSLPPAPAGLAGVVTAGVPHGPPPTHAKGQDYRRLGGGAQRPNREIVSFRSCVRARGDCQVEMSLKRHPPGFPFSLFAAGGFPFSLGILPLLPSCYPALAGFIGI